jgi:uncharacterized membrane protein YgaE (UPF0421/DUF939 family)
MIALTNFNAIRFTQALKTGVAAVLAVYLTRLFKLPQGYWGAISAIVVMQSEVGATFSASRDRFLGTAVGAFLGAVFVTLGGVGVLWFGVATIATVLVCQLLGLDQSYRLACVTVAIVMLINGVGSPWRFALHRFLEVSVGILVALIVSSLPPRAPGQLHNPRVDV